jgi:nitroimidazol reductase NimA-like FMN-containing flavoprotein (pyridoxamine 5'-phosphate oxidase superfamily)
MPTPEQSAQIIAVLDGAADLTLATNGADGYPHATTLAFAHDGMAIYIGTSAASRKAGNLARDDRVSLTVNRPYRGWDEIMGVSIAGRARRVSAPEEFLKAGQLMLAKYPSVAQLAPANGADVALFRIDAERILLLDYAKGHGHSEVIKL